MKKIGLLLFLGVIIVGLLIVIGIGAPLPSTNSRDDAKDSTVEDEPLVEVEDFSRTSANMVNDKLDGLILDQASYNVDLPAEGVVNINAGTVSAWLKLSESNLKGDQAIFHTNDFRIVFSIDYINSSEGDGKVYMIKARAVGNQRHIDIEGEEIGNYAETFIVIDEYENISKYGDINEWYSIAPFPNEEWHLVTMTWDGYPDGVVKIYLDDKFIAQKQYNSNYDYGNDLFTTYRIGNPANQWTGDIINDPGVEMKNIQIYQEALTDAQIADIYNQSS